MWLKLAIAAFVEVTYCIVTRAWLPAQYQGVELELLTTAGRLISLTIFFLLFRQLIFRRTAEPSRALHPLALTAIAILLVTPVAVGNYALPTLAAQLVFALGSIAVAAKEEFLYRGVLQNLLEGRVSVFWAVGLSNIVFTLYHYGAQPFTVLSLTEMFAAGCLLGLLYAVSGSMVLVIFVHALNDAIWSFTPILDPPMPRPVGSILLLIALGLCAMWTLRSNRRLLSDTNSALRAYARAPKPGR